jgi:endonuclease/exonuclease/phosphatase family metal-dependent hydrolase
VKRVRGLSVVAAGTMALGALVAASSPSQAAGVATPPQFTAVTSTPGPGPGEVTFSWSASGANTTAYAVITGLTLFSPGQKGRDAHTFTFPAGTTSGTLTAAQTTAAGASASSANHLYYRFEAINSTSGGTATRLWPYEGHVAVQPDPVADSGTPLRVASFNMRSSLVHDSHTWLSRKELVAKTIISRDPGIVLTQELGPERADGVSGPAGTHARQDSSLLTELSALHDTKYRLVRTTSYTTQAEGSQGERILYDHTRYRLLSNCPDTTNGHSYSTSCQMTTPVRASDSPTLRRHAGYAEFQDIASGDKFWVASVHLDQRHSSKASTEVSLDTLRATQLKAVMARLKLRDTGGWPIILGGDFNSWQYDVNGDRAHDALIAAGYYDTAAAQTQVHLPYSTFNGFAKTMTINASGYNSRLDVIGVKGITGAVKFENVMNVTDSHRASDHNMIVTDILLPDPVVSAS